jgi:hypothetical protein
MADGDDLVLGQVNEATSTTVLNTQGPALAVTANSGIGVSGTTNDESTQSAGVYGTSNGSAGVVGESINAPGVSGGSVNAYGMVGTSTNADGVLGNGGGGANGVTGWGDLARRKARGCGRSPPTALPAARSAGRAATTAASAAESLGLPPAKLHRLSLAGLDPPHGTGRSPDDRQGNRKPGRLVALRLFFLSAQG